MEYVAKSQEKKLKCAANFVSIQNVLGNQAVIQCMDVIQMGQEHHIIPEALSGLCDHLFSGGYDYLFSKLTVTLEYHIGSHPNYTAAVSKALLQIQKNGGNDKEAQQFADNLGIYLTGLEGLDLNQFTFDEIKQFIPDGLSDTQTSSGRVSRMPERYGG